VAKLADKEVDNLRAALAWSLESRRVEAGLRLANALVGLWLIRSQRGRASLARSCWRKPQRPAIGLARKGAHGGGVCGQQNDAPSAQACVTLAVALCGQPVGRQPALAARWPAWSLAPRQAAIY
jgi:hypothetical protein